MKNLKENQRIITNNCCFTLIKSESKMVNIQGETIILKGFKIDIMNPKDNIFRTINAPEDFTTLNNFVNSYFGHHKNLIY
jgi:hypothetical protein